MVSNSARYSSFFQNNLVKYRERERRRVGRRKEERKGRKERREGRNGKKEKIMRVMTTYLVVISSKKVAVSFPVINHIILRLF